eukprot:745942_1
MHAKNSKARPNKPSISSNKAERTDVPQSHYPFRQFQSNDKIYRMFVEPYMKYTRMILISPTIQQPINVTLQTTLRVQRYIQYQMKMFLRIHCISYAILIDYMEYVQ